MRGVGLGQISLRLLQSLILPFLGKVVERGLCRNAVLKGGLGTRLYRNVAKYVCYVASTSILHTT